MASTLYICYFGVRQPLVQTQVIPYLCELIRPSGGGTPDDPELGLKVFLLTFEPETIDKAEEAKLRAELSAKGIEWSWLRYHKRPSALATAYDVFRGSWYIRNLIGREEIDILHGRVHIPSLMGALARRFSSRQPKLLFDIRGFFPEEYTDAGVWPEKGWLYRSAKRVERWLMKESDGFVVLTEKARSILFPESEETGFDEAGRPVEVIPCCVDFESRFAKKRAESREKTRREMQINGRFVVTHLGALGGLYLTREIADFLAVAKREDPWVFAMFLTQTDPQQILTMLAERGFATSDYYVGRAAPSDVEDYLNASDVGLSFVKAGYATASRSPTKIPEYLACGLPVIANRGVGDVDSLIEERNVGVLLDSFDESAYLNAMRKVVALRDVSARCQETAHSEFDLRNVGGVRYRRLYRHLLDHRGSTVRGSRSVKK